MLRVARKKTLCNVLGPGTRSVIWFYGCSKRCLGCIAKTMNETDEYELYTPEQLAEWVFSNDRVEGRIEGVTLSGGEPFEQPADLLGQFLEIVRRNSKLSVLSYTGYRYEQLNKDEKNHVTLQYVDVLIDGEYRIDQDSGTLWRGSANQRFHFLTKRYRSEAEVWNSTFERPVEIELDLQGKLLVSGVPSKEFIDKLTTELHKRGVDTDFSQYSTSSK